MSKINFKKVGIGILIVDFVYLIFSSILKTIILALMYAINFGKSKDAVNILFNAISQQPLYIQIILIMGPIIELIIFIWALIIGIKLIKTKKYTPQSKYLIFFMMYQYLIFFIIFTLLGNYYEASINLVLTILIYTLIIRKNSPLSKLITN